MGVAARSGRLLAAAGADGCLELNRDQADTPLDVLDWSDGGPWPISGHMLQVTAFEALIATVVASASVYVVG